MPSRFASSTRAELLDALARLEAEAGVATDPASAPDPAWRSLRDAYFGVFDRKLRLDLIRMRLELDRREHATSVLRVLSAGRELERARSALDWRILLSAILLPLVLVALGHTLAGIPGEIAGLVAALLLVPVLLRDHRRRTARAVAKAEHELAEARESARLLAMRAPPFSDTEADRGVEDTDPVDAAAPGERRPGSAHGAGLAADVLQGLGPLQGLARR
jgi:hypothetical protein